MDTLYHYCPTKSFLDIISSRAIRLSSLSLSNDTMEGRLVSHIFENLLKGLKLGPEEMIDVKNMIILVENIFDGLGFCLSEKPDSLSQWRGYADDGQGFTVGFSKDYLDELIKIKSADESYRLTKVLYQESEHIEALQPALTGIRKLIDSGKLQRPQPGTILAPLSDQDYEEKLGAYLDSLMLNCWQTFPSIYTLKGHAFSEEAEWRLLSFHSRNDIENIYFKESRDRIIPYRELKLEPLNLSSIVKVYVGPKNITPEHLLRKFLQIHGFPKIEIVHSAATYR